jgi:chemotaxis protein methyltransferase CheR
MKYPGMENDILHITDFLKRIYDVDISRYDGTYLDKALNARIFETNVNSRADYSDFLEQNSDEARILIDNLNISYSLFFRNSLTYSVLEKIILPGLFFRKKSQRQKEIRIWSAACASGQEPYSLAILLEELKNGNNGDVNYRIFATDLSEFQVSEAERAYYSSDAIANINLARIQNWFKKSGDNYVIKPELKKNIDFSVFDLFSDQLDCPSGSIFGDFDIVVCANLLFYYKKKDQEILIDKVANCLTNGGYLVTGETERNIIIQYGFKEVFPQSSIFRSAQRFA